MPISKLAFEHSMCALCSEDDGEPVAVGEDFEYRVSGDSFLIMRCRRCGLLYLNPRPAQEESTRIYPDNYHAFNFTERHYGLIHRVRRRLEARRLLKWCRGLPENARILDVGCGDGFHLGLLREFGRSTWQYYGVDRDERAVIRARESGLTVYHGLIESMPKGELFDVALMIMTIEHLADPLQTLKAVSDQLRPGGRVVVVTDNLGSPDAFLFRGRHWGGYHFPRHFYLFNADTLQQLAERSGLRAQSIVTGFSPVNWVYSIRNVLDDWHLPKWLVSRFSLRSPVSLAVFTTLDVPLSILGRGAILQAVFVKYDERREQGVTTHGNTTARGRSGSRFGRTNRSALPSSTRNQRASL